MPSKSSNFKKDKIATSTARNDKIANDKIANLKLEAADIIPSSERRVISEPLGKRAGAFESLGSGFTKNEAGAKREVVGVTTARLVYIPDVLTETIFDYTSRPGYAEILLYNSYGTDVELSGLAIVGKPVIKVGGEDGFIHDDFADYDSIAKDGEIAFKLGNDFICTKKQVEALADYWWKYFDPSDRKHIYAGFVNGTRYDLMPGARYTLSILVDRRGIYEQIDSTVELYSSDVEKTPGQPGRTSFIFREVQENWFKTAFAKARFSVAGNAQRKVSRSTFVTVGSSTFTEATDYVCDGTDDNVQIQAAIGRSAAAGGGTVLLSPGTFNIEDGVTIDIADNVSLIGCGSSTIVKALVDGSYINIGSSSNTKVANILIQTAIRASGASSVSIQNIDFGTSLPTAVPLIVVSSSDNVQISNIYAPIVKSASLSSIDISGSRNVTLSDVVITGNNTSLTLSSPIITISTSTSVVVSNISIVDILTSSIVGLFYVNSDAVSLSNIIIDNAVSTTSAGLITGLHLKVDNCTLSSIVIRNITNATAPGDSVGLWIWGDNNTLSSVRVYSCSGVGIRIASTADQTRIVGGRTSGNGTDYIDEGTGTVLSAFATS